MITMHTARIYGVSPSDPPSYITTSVFYEELFNWQYGTGEYTGLIIAHTFDDAENTAQLITDTLKSEYFFACYTGNEIEGCVKDTSPDPESYCGKQVILFNDHGGPREWVDTIKSEDLEWLDFPYSFAMACLTNNYWQGGGKVFGANFIRKGGSGYHGAGGIASGERFAHYSSKECNAIRYLTDKERIAAKGTIPLGELHSLLIISEDTIYKDFILLADSTLVPKFKEVDWT